MTAHRFLHLARHGDAVDDGDLSEAGREQATRLGRRLARLPIAAVHHGPLPRAAQTAALVAEHLPGVPVRAAEEVGDYVPPVPDPSALPEPYARFLAEVPPAEYERGARLAAAAIARHAGPGDASHELVITHSFTVAWFVRHALDAPRARWLGLNAANTGLTTILYRADRPPALVAFNDLSHLPERLRWTGFPAEVRAALGA
ncbi:histidine phosphatase family protein [Phytohabitans suffuscus]|uniref:Phosphoglycerate mutase n=1 Tax=Phytohabitans suffuscus TaxID=624315 RepID=A0A6F8YZ41_9ACTN|nr:histidine phosphatase family protein [Phytohabitans suffuscus]BCB91198.1 phosphoglycerate mutase [Phytohabitans suffuscus]